MGQQLVISAIVYEGAPQKEVCGLPCMENLRLEPELPRIRPWFGYTLRLFAPRMHEDLSTISLLFIGFFRVAIPPQDLNSASRLKGHLATYRNSLLLSVHVCMLPTWRMSCLVGIPVTVFSSGWKKNL